MLFNIAQSHKAYFGQKDAQQLTVIRRMVTDLNIPVEIVPCPTIREPEGLAMSSRNEYLNPEQRQQALSLNRALDHGQKLIQSGQTDSDSIITAMEKIITQEPQAKIDYISIVDNELLQPVSRIDRTVLIALAVSIGPARLIDNITVDPSKKKQ